MGGVRVRLSLPRCKKCGERLESRASGWYDVSTSGDIRYFHKECVPDREKVSRRD